MPTIKVKVLTVSNKHSLQKWGKLDINLILERFYFINIAQFSKKIYPPWHPQLLTLALNQKSACTFLFASSNAFQNDMTWSGSAKNHGVDRFHGKGLNAGQGLPCRDWEGVLPIQAVLNRNRVTYKNFIQFCPSIQKLFMVFFNTDTQTDGHTNSIQNESPHYPIRVRGKIFYTPFFLPLSDKACLSKWCQN